MVINRGHDGAGQGRARRLTKVASLAMGAIMFGTIGLSGTLAQEEEATVGIADAETIVNSIIAEVFAEIFGGEVAADAAVSDAGDVDVGGSTGSTVTMGGGGDISVGGGTSGGVTVGDEGDE